jgi:hypothetical protein
MRLVSIKGHNINFLLIPWCAWVSVSKGPGFPRARLARAVLTDSNEAAPGRETEYSRG